MSLSLIVVVLGAVVAAAGTVTLAARAARRPSPALLAWTAAVLGLAVALGSQAVGYLAGYSALLFRAMELGAQLLAPLALCLGLAEVVARRLPARFAMRLVTSGLAIVLAVALGSDPLNQSRRFSKAWPDPAVFYEPVPLALIGILALFIVVTVLVSVLATAAGSRRAGPGSRAGPVLAASAAALALAEPGLSWFAHSAGVRPPASDRGMFALACTAAAALTWYAAVAAQRAGVLVPAGRVADEAGDGRADGGEGPDDQGGGMDGRYQTGEFDGYGRGDYDQRGLPGDDPRAYRDDPAHGWPGPAGGRVPQLDSQSGYPGLAALAAEFDDPPPGAAGYRDPRAPDGAMPPGAPYAGPPYDGPPYDGSPYDGPPYDGDGPYRGPRGEPGPPALRGAYDRDPYGPGPDAGGPYREPANGAWPYDGGGPYPGPRGEPGPPAVQGDPYRGEWDAQRRALRDGYANGGPSPGAAPYGEEAGHGGPRPPDGAGTSSLFGQITIYTLIEERAGDFDRLTERMVARVQAREPDTLVYIVHAVPTAPMQRILYEVYRDRAAYEEHLRQPYMVRYEAERRPLVLATNVIELGLQQAKVTPFPSISAISDILSESGIDLTGVVRSRGRIAGGNGHEPRGLPAPGQGGQRPVPDRYDGPGYAQPYQQGWDEIRGRDPGYR